MPGRKGVLERLSGLDLAVDSREQPSPLEPPGWLGRLAAVDPAPEWSADQGDQGYQEYQEHQAAAGWERELMPRRAALPCARSDAPSRSSLPLHRYRRISTIKPTPPCLHQPTRPPAVSCTYAAPRSVY